MIVGQTERSDQSCFTDFLSSRR